MHQSNVKGQFQIDEMQTHINTDAKNVSGDWHQDVIKASQSHQEKMNSSRRVHKLFEAGDAGE